MIAMTWRQHRAQLLIAAAALLTAVTYLLITGAVRASYADRIGLTACLAGKARDCGSLTGAWISRFGGIPVAFTLLAGLPLLAGLFWGAPLIAREVETGTYRVAWTQSVSRTHWLAVKLSMFLAVIVAAAAALSLSFSYWFHLYSQVSNAGYSDVARLAPPAFDLSGIAPLGTMLFAFGIGTAAGALIRRTVPAMAVTLGGYLGAILPLETMRYTILAPLTTTGRFTNSSFPLPNGAYSLSTGYATASGRPVPFSYLFQVCGHQLSGNQVGIHLSCLVAHGFRSTEVYQPASRYWPLQGIYAGSLALAGVALIGVAIWWTARRVS